MRSLLSLSLLAVSLFTGFAAAEPHGHRRNHDSIAHRANADVGIHKRFSSSRWTYYDVGMGACGQSNSRGDFIVALNSGQYGGGYPGPNCFKSITMSYNGKTAKAMIMDECPGCPWGGLDLSRGLFDFFASESEGVLTGEWWFNDGSGGDDPTTSKWTPPKTSSWKPPLDIPTPTWQPPSSKWEPPSSSPTPSPSSKWEPPSSAPSPPPSSSSSSSSSSTPSVSIINFSSGAASGLAVPSGTVPENPQQPGSHGLLGLNQAIVGIAAVVVAGART